MPCSIRRLGKRSAVNFALKNVQSKVKKILSDRGTLKKILFFPQELKLLFSSRSIYQTTIKIKSVSMCLNSNNCYCLYEDKKAK